MPRVLQAAGPLPRPQTPLVQRDAGHLPPPQKPMVLPGARHSLRPQTPGTPLQQAGHRLQAAARGAS
jgi:hypothetical protein